MRLGAPSGVAMCLTSITCSTGFLGCVPTRNIALIAPELTVAITRAPSKKVQAEKREPRGHVACHVA